MRNWPLAICSLFLIVCTSSCDVPDIETLFPISESTSSPTTAIFQYTYHDPAGNDYYQGTTVIKETSATRNNTQQSEPPSLSVRATSSTNKPAATTNNGPAQPSFTQAQSIIPSTATKPKLTPAIEKEIYDRVSLKYVSAIYEKKRERDKKLEELDKEARAVSVKKRVDEANLIEECANLGLSNSGYYESRLKAIQQSAQQKLDRIKADTDAANKEYQDFCDACEILIQAEVSLIIDNNYTR